MGWDAKISRFAAIDVHLAGGYRTLILYRQTHRAFFVYGFAKSQQANIGNEEETAFKKAARHVLELTDKQLAALIQNGQCSEVEQDGETVS
nr:type II toxin-antitoxin system RelE/ParE family toxin [Lamprobacter modestohalophilus]